ncbi:NUDIX hydrolase [Dysosmobacter sp. Sow4_B12]|uniref:NUDIX hydrolase n=1 Tax=Dysosmobacter sp. Sow4_B12 TaxID=3438777 RepID=UPI003F8F95D1
MRELDALYRRYGGHQPGLLGARHSYAVLCPLVERPDGLHLLFEVRGRNLSQPGEVCFPGGRMEAEESPVQCALRETEEELSIPPSAVTVLGTPDFICNQMGFLLRPVLGLVSPAGFAAMSPSPAEVAEVFTAPLRFFKETAPEPWRYELVPQVPEDFPYESVGIPRDYPWNHGWVDVPVWYWHGRAVWGMTARLVRDIAGTL